MRSIVFAVAVVSIAVVVSMPSFSQALPPACVLGCCNYCNLTYEFKNSCNQSYTELLQAVNENSNYSVSTADPSIPYLHAVHTTVSSCCPPGFHYHEDVYFYFTKMMGCQVVGYSHSRAGTCDLGTDYRNIQDLVNATTLVYNGWTINSGCEYNGVAPPGTALWKDDVPSSIANSNSNNNNKNHNNNHNSNDNNNKNKAEEQQYQLHYTPIRFQL